MDPRAIVGEQRMIGPEADPVDRIIIDRLRARIGLGQGQRGAARERGRNLQFGSFLS